MLSDDAEHFAEQVSRQERGPSSGRPSLCQHQHRPHEVHLQLQQGGHPVSGGPNLRQASPEMARTKLDK